MQHPPLAPQVAAAASIADPGADIFRMLLRDRIVFLGTDVNDTVANQLVAQLLYLEGEDPEKDIWLYINSPGGSVTAGMAIYDTMQFVVARRGHHLHGPGRLDGPVPARAPAPPGKRYALPARPHHDAPALGGVQGQASDIAIQAEQMALHQAPHGRAHRRPHRPDGRADRRATPSATVGSPPSRPRTTASSTT